MGPFATASRYWHSLRYQTTRQWLGRLRNLSVFKTCALLQAVGSSRAIESWVDRRSGSTAASFRPGFRFPEPDSVEIGGYLGHNLFRFQNRERQFGAKTEWNAPGLPLLWRFHLNYFDWAPRLAAEGRREELLGQIQDWISSNPVGAQPMWHPFPTSLRLVNWIRALSSQDESIPPTVSQSLARQAGFLEATLETHLGANHLIENAYALLVAGLALEASSANRWLNSGLALLQAELKDQVLPDGGHFERSLSYHFRVNLVCREAIALLAANGHPVPPDLPEIDARMQRFLCALCHPDGGIALFQDSQQIDPTSWSRFEQLQPARLQAS